LPFAQPQPSASKRPQRRAATQKKAKYIDMASDDDDDDEDEDEEDSE
jgi:hypothetical protein